MTARSRMDHNIDMCSGPLLKKMLLFAVPLMLSSMLQLLFNAVDVMVVSRFAGDNAMAAVGANGSLISLMVNLFVGLSVGSNVLAARERGAGQPEELRRTVHTTMALSLVGGLTLVAVGELLAGPILKWMQVPPAIRGLAEIYLRIYFLGMPATMLYNFGAALLRSVGDTRRPMYYLTAAGVVNVLLNLLLVIVFRMAVAGVAVATVISQYISAALVVRCLIRGTGDIRLVLRRLRIHRDKMTEILRIGLPAGIQGTVTSFANVTLQSAINSFGEVVVAAASAGSSIEAFIQCGVTAMNQTTVSFTSQNLGAGKMERIPRVVGAGVTCILAWSAVTVFICSHWGELLLGIYSDTDAVIRAGMVRFGYIVTSYVFCGLLNVMVGGQRGLGHSLTPMLVSLAGSCGLRLLWLATVFQIPAYHTIETVYMCYPFSWSLTFLAHFISWLVIMRCERKRMADGEAAEQ